VTRPPAPAGGYRVEAARPEDDAALRALLRAQAMDGAIRLTLEREPALRLAAEVEGERHYTVVLRQPESGRILACGSRAVRLAWVDGRPARLGYLAQLRRLPAAIGFRRALAAGYAACEASRRPDELPYDLTAVVADNRAARRLLERGLPGLPIYRPWSELVTLVLPVGGPRRRRPTAVERGTAELLPAIAACLERNLRRHQFAPAWTASDLASPVRTRGLEAADFCVVREPGGGDRIAGCLALWDQRAFKQVVVRGYAPALARLRPLVNAVSWLRGGPRLPVPGGPLALAFLSHLAVDDDRPELLIELVRAARQAAARRGLDYLSCGLAEGNPMLPALRRAFRARALTSIVYLVHRREAEPRLALPDGRCPHLEVAVL
jgi:hypothetical protein